MSNSRTVLQGVDRVIQGELYMSFKLGDKQWRLTLSDGRRGPSRYSVGASDTAAVAQCIGKARERCKLESQTRVHSCYEAGRDGWWLHRWLVEQGIDNIVVDSASIEASLDQPPATVCFRPTACADQGSVNSHLSRLDKRVLIEGARGDFLVDRPGHLGIGRSPNSSSKSALSDSGHSRASSDVRT